MNILYLYEEKQNNNNSNHNNDKNVKLELSFPIGNVFCMKTASSVAQSIGLIRAMSLDPEFVDSFNYTEIFF